MGMLDRWRKPKQKQALDFSSPAFLEMLRTGDVSSTISAEQAIRISTVYACNKVIGETIKSLPCNLYKYDGESKVRQDQNRLQRLVHDAPNDWMTAAEFWEYQVTNMNLNGNSYNVIVRTSSDKIVSIIPVAYHRVSPRIQNGRLIQYDINFGDGNTDRFETYAPRDILHFRGMTLDGLSGISPIAYNSAMLSQAKDARDYASNVFVNGATPRGVLSTDGTLSDEAHKNISESWEAAHQGVANAHRIAILEGGLKFEKISMSPDDVQLLETRKLTRSEIAGIFRVPPHMIADLDRSTFNNIEHQTLDFYKGTIAPWLATFEQRLNLMLAPGDINLRFRFDVRELIRGDLKTEVEAYGQLISLGVLSPNEVRERLDYNPREGGDEYIQGSNNLDFGNNETQETEDDDD